MIKNSRPFDAKFVWPWLLTNLIIGILVPLTYSPASYLSLGGWIQLGDDILYCFLVSMGISGSVGLVERILDPHYSWIKQPARRFLLEFAGVTLLSFTAVFVINFIFFWALGAFELHKIPWNDLLRQTRIPILIGYGITAFFVSRGFLMEWRQAAVDSEKLRSERYKGQVRLLKDQLNPHFLFNSLNVLTNVVYEDPDKAAHYIRQLSKFYRHVLEVQDEEVVPLQDEVDFTKRYLELQQQRFGDALQLKLSLNEAEGFQLPPLVLQLLVENAIKHNSVSEEKPLQIEIEQRPGHLLIRNNCNPKREVESSTGIGLTNIRERYALLSNTEVEVKQDDKYFEVRLPLLKLN